MPTPLTQDQLDAGANSLVNGAADGGVTISVPAAVPAPTTLQTSKLFTEEEVEAIRKQEKDKLYKTIESERERVTTLSTQMEQINREREEARAAAILQQQEEDAARKAREEEELSAKELVKRQAEEFTQKLSAAETEWNQRLAALQEERDAAARTLEMEQQYQALNSYKQRRLAEEQENILPDLMDFVTGSSEEEIEQSISTLVARTDAIMDKVQQSLPPQRVRGISPLGGTPTGPLENNTEQKTFTLNDLKGMTMKEYESMRDGLLAQARPRR